MSMSISIAVVCDICDGAMDTLQRSKTAARAEAKRVGWTSSRGCDRCPDCTRDGLAFAYEAGRKLQSTEAP